MKGIKKRIISIGEQIASIKSKYPDFKLGGNHKELIVVGFLQPTSRSLPYTFELKYSINSTPSIRVVSPPLMRNENNDPIPHMFHQKRLCLYRGIYGEFSNTGYLTMTIIPWIGLWLYHYENWHLTGEWMGGGEHPESNSK